MNAKKLLSVSFSTMLLFSLPGCANSDWLTSCCGSKDKKETSKQTRTSNTESETKAADSSNQTIISLESKEALDELIQSGNPLVVKVYTEWCGACKEMNQPFSDVAQELSGITFSMANADKVSSLVSDYGIRGVPVFLLFKDGKEVSADNRIIGVVSKDEFKKVLELNLLK